MAIKTKQELLDSIKVILGDNQTSDEALALLEDVSDTVDSFTQEESGEDWEAKYHELDETWRKKYSDRFFQRDEEDGQQDDASHNSSHDQQLMEAEEVSIDDLFENK